MGNKTKENTEIEFNDIVKRYQQQLYWHIRRLVVDYEEAKDILQDVFLLVFNNLDSLRDPATLKAWLYRIATNESLRYLHTLKESPVSSEEVSEILTAKLYASEYVDYDNEMEVKFQKALLSLTEYQRTVFDLRYYDELSYEEISYITGGSVGSLKVTWHNAKEKIKEYLTNN